MKDPGQPIRRRMFTFDDPSPWWDSVILLIGIEGSLIGEAWKLHDIEIACNGILFAYIISLTVRGLRADLREKAKRYLQGRWYWYIAIALTCVALVGVVFR
ncbi:MAG: hypothetical protein F8N36_14400 [Desulfovibrio sp.]|uniref:hypothetical protein n=1 Tax=Desulfovibrio sp. TaxID=885 RepID=UPI00135E65A2|nr:hypothetical protein [Desulfovibrio sp.]MTJ94029.1 hypothetical protein [Desulfovibrio sp.]